MSITCSTSSLRRIGQIVFIAIVVGALSRALLAANTDVSTETDLRAAISGASDGDTITSQADIILTADLPVVQKSVTIIGNDHTLSGETIGNIRGVSGWPALLKQ